MKKLSRIICLALSIVLALGAFSLLIACPKPKVKITFNSAFEGEAASLSYAEVEKGKYITDSVMPSDPKPYVKETKDSNGVVTATEDYLFEFWTLDGTTDYVATTKVDKAVTLKAKFRLRAANEIVAHFDTEGGGRVKTQILKPGDKPSKPSDPTMKGAKFDKWIGGDVADASGGYDFSAPINDDTYIRATWIMGVGQTLVLSSAAFDNVFSPFFSTSAYDGSVHGQTQIPMLSANRKGNVYVGEDVPTLVKDYNYKITYKGSETFDQKEVDNLPLEDKLSGELYRTDYEFVIKNGVKDSEGKDITIKDVLFNMYVYLDPMYTGSNTMYSTNIIGLNAYRTQDRTATATSASGDSTARANAAERMSRLRNYFSSVESTQTSTRRDISVENEKKLLDDVQMLRELLWEELCSDWRAANSLDKDSNGYIEGYQEHEFKHAWEVFLFGAGIITAVYDPNTGMIDKKAAETKHGIRYGMSEEWHHDGLSLIKIVFNELAGILSVNEGSSEVGNYFASNPNEKPIIDFPVDESTFKKKEGGFPKGDPASAADKEDLDTLLGRIRTNNISRGLHSGIIGLTYYWQSGQKLYDEMLVSEKSNIFKELIGDGDRDVEKIDGITVAKTKTFTNVDGKVKNYDDDHYVLKVAIGGVDPKAIWNFSFAVAPMWYYSNPDGKDNSLLADGYESFNYPGVDGYKDNKQAHLGFKQLSNEYFKNVLRHPSVIAVPVGAGPFKATNLNNDTGIPEGTGFERDGIVYFERNEYFKTTGAAMNNVKFQYMRYKVIDTSKVLDAIRTGDVDFGDPAAKIENYTPAMKDDSLEVKLVTNNGYGYVGINARWVPDLPIRKAIMTALYTDHIMSYYPNGFAKHVERSMSLVSSYYPTGAPDAYPYKSKSEAVAKIREYVEEAGYKSSKVEAGAWAKTNEQTGETTNLRFVFTVAGATTDHPAYKMFEEAAKLLNDPDLKLGFHITVKNDPQALRKLGNGELEVWAAAWSSTVDPDMFQVYHKDSQATSVNNWGYPYLLTSGTKEEKDLLDELAKEIDAGRRILNPAERKEIYARALDLVMDLAIEYPTYQRENMYVFDRSKINAETVNKSATAYLGLIDEIWKVALLR